MTTVYVLAALLVIAASIFYIPALASPVRVIPRRPETTPIRVQYKVDFQLQFTAFRRGYIVQHVTIRERVTKCQDPTFANPEIDRRREFWEAWPVRPFTREPEPPPAGVPAHDYDDNFSYNAPFGEMPYGMCRAKVEVRAVVRFFPGVTLPATFRRRNPDTQAGYALSDKNRPPFWKAGGTRHDLTAEWEQCPGVEGHWVSIDEFPKARE